MKIGRMIGAAGICILLTVSLSSCSKSLPHDERYRNIDNTLTQLDYKTVGEITEEEIDNGDGVLVPSYKKIYYGNDGAFKELEKRLDAITDDCTGRTNEQLNCTYPKVNVRVFYNQNRTAEFDYESVIHVVDGSGGRN